MLELQSVCGVTGPVYVVNDQDPDFGTQCSHITCFTSVRILTMRTPDLEPSIASNLTRRSLAPRMLTYADVCWRILTYAGVWWQSPLLPPTSRGAASHQVLSLVALLVHKYEF